MTNKDFNDARMADAPTGGNVHASALIKHYVDTGKPFPFSLPNSFYLYADDYFGSRRVQRRELTSHCMSERLVNTIWTKTSTPTAASCPTPTIL